jgi:hypothetical protein
LQGKVQLAPRKTTAKKRRTRTAGRRRPRSKRKSVPRETHVNALIVILMFLYMLRLMDEKTFKRIQKDLAPKKRKIKRRRPR